ncbi:hypothetical protein [Dokdonella sp.]|uniref:hypothetical protein n=1 Tax=Dokdonella sp. TaxID=2291710 RepID=UPI002F3EB9A3
MAAWLESAWLARYLDRQLEGEELAWFEAYLLDKPELVEAVEVDAGLRNSLSVDRALFRPQRSRRALEGLRKISISVTASLVLGASAGWFARGVGDGDAPAIMPNPARMLFDTFRGLSVVPELDESDPQSPFVLIEVSVPPEARQVVLIAGEQSPMRLVGSSDGFVSFLVRRDATPSRLVLRYEINGRVIQYPLQVAHSKRR